MDAFVEAIKALVFGIVEGITEWLPISSTGHMMLLNQFMPLDVSASFYDTFLVVIQLGAILAVIILYFHKLNPFSSRKTRFQRRETWGIWAKVVVGSIPAAIVGLLFDDWVEDHIMNDPHVAYIVVSVALIVYGILFIVIERHNRKKIRRAQMYIRGPMSLDAIRNLTRRDPEVRGKHARPMRENVMVVDSGNGSIDPNEEDGSSIVAKVNSFDELGYGRAFVIGIFQSLAVIPGTSRSGSIIIGSLVLGTSRTIATEFAFFLAIPIMLGWSLLKFFRHGFDYTGTEWMIFGIGIVTAFLVSIAAIKFLVGYIKQNDFTAFGVYRIIVGAFVLFYFSSIAAGFLWS